jgi:hypothetical protein
MVGAYNSRFWSAHRRREGRAPGRPYARIGTTLRAIGADVSRSASAVPAVTTTAGMKTNTKETTVNAPTTESSVETTRMEVVMMEKT